MRVSSPVTGSENWMRMRMKTCSLGSGVGLRGTAIVAESSELDSAVWDMKIKTQTTLDNARSRRWSQVQKAAPNTYVCALPP
jgi:hypothetical protein